MDTNKTKWGLIEWQAYALALEKSHQSALDGWGTTVTELEAHSKLVAQLQESNATLRNHIELLQNAMLMIPTQPTTKRGRGRPKKHEGLDLASWYETECLPKYKAQNHGISSGMQRVLTWYFQQVFREHGLNPLKVNSKNYQSKLKTMVNVISDQRHPRRSVATS